VTISELLMGKRDEPAIDPSLFTDSDEDRTNWPLLIVAAILAAYLIHVQAWGFANPGKTHPSPLEQPK